jgi:D-tagatose-1,6-bisphosphate aldolase subunit GatZ/KbaZ
MKINKIISNKALPSFCTSNTEVIKTILFFCHIKKLPCLIECTSNQVNQHGGYTNKTPKMFIKEILSISKKIKFDSKKLFLGGDHLGPLPWKKKSNTIAIKNSISLINDYLDQKFCKIHIDTSIKCKNDNYINSDIIFERTNEILNNDNIKKKIKDKFLVVGTEVPLSGSGDNENIIKTSKKQIETEVLKFKKILKKQNLKNNIFGLVIEPGMKYMHSSVTKPNFTNFTNKKNISKKNNFVYEAHSTDYQPKKILKQLVKNNFKFLKVGPELTYSYSRSLFFMENIEKHNFKLKNSNIKKIIFSSMLKNRKYWEGYYQKKTPELLLNSKLDRMRYYFNTKSVVNSIKTLKKNINLLDKKSILCFMNLTEKKEFLNFKNKKLSNFDIIKLIFISRTLKRYFSACSHGFN